MFEDYREYMNQVLNAYRFLIRNYFLCFNPYALNKYTRKFHENRPTRSRKLKSEYLINQTEHF